MSTIDSRPAQTADLALGDGGEPQPHILDPVVFELILEIGQVDQQRRRGINNEFSLRWLMSLYDSEFAVSSCG